MSREFFSSLSSEQARWQDVLLTTEPRLRMSLITTGCACLLMLFSILIMEWLGHLGMANPQWVRWWAIISGAGVLLSFVLIRSGVTRYWEDPAFTAAQMFFAITSNVVAYVIAGPARGVPPLVLSIIMMFAVFGLRPSKLMAVVLYGFVAYAAAGAFVQWGLPDDPMPGSLAVIYLAVVSMVLFMTAVLSLHANAMRERLQIQKNELAEAVAQIHEVATRDELTGLPNRRYMQDMLRLEELRVKRSGQPLMLAQLDLDFFKKVNDTYGHVAGDQVLQDFARKVQGCIRATDIWARWGGEEFVLLMTNTSQADGAKLLERVRARVADHPALLGSGIEVAYTVSIGAALLQEGDTAAALLEQTDAALYRAKHEGRNRVVWAGDRPSPGLAPAPSRLSPAPPVERADCTTRSSCLQTAP